ncbi:MAG: hypothetical protein Q8O67_00435 [Deltaproteobacteria bacterium]|nr:hypothetical protein [Deltaproteobacteria bacterium]
MTFACGRALLTAVLLGVAIGAFTRASVAAPPPRSPLVGAAVSPEACGRCHREELKAWRGSRHSLSSTNPIFAASYAHWPNGWCLQCHAPRPAQQVAVLGHPARAGTLAPVPAARPPSAFDDGVDCAACHVVDGVVVSASDVTPLGQQAHAMRHEPALATEVLCARCHEFAFQQHTPAWPFALSGSPAQSTVSEWRASWAASAGRRCQDCHMKNGGHGFPGAHDEAFVRAHVSAHVRRDGDTVIATITATDAAHRVPTGDPFRRLELDLCRDVDCAVVDDRLSLRRVLRVTAAAWETAEDRTVPVADTTSVATRTLTSHAARARYFRLSYRFGDRRFEPLLTPADVGYVIATGSILEASP